MSTVRWLCVVSVLWVAGCAGAGRTAGGVERGIQMARYPSHWWAAVPREEARWWEILPQEAGEGEVIVSKRNELGLLSNFAPTPFVFRGRRYPSLEGLWQMMKYPEGPADPRAMFPGINWEHTREEVSQMVGPEAKAAGDLGSENMRAIGIDWVTFDGRRMKYRGAGKGEHYELIVAALREKVRQNPKVREVLLSTGDLVLRPDHHQDPDAPPAWRYCETLMEIREELRGSEAGRSRPTPARQAEGGRVGLS